MVVRRARLRTFLLALASVLILAGQSPAEIKDPFDPFDITFDISTDAKEDQGKTPQELIQEAELLFMDERPLDARTKLLRALQKDPKAFQAHKLLAGYYLIHVGHFRLALKYIKRSIELFEEQRGKPPYRDYVEQSEHAHLLHLLSQIRLNLDNYQGALEVLDEYSSYGYYQSWYPGSRAWVLMKLGKLDDAIQTARLGLLTGGEKGRTLNILGILLSLTGDRDASIQVFQQAIRHELSMGPLGQPATPLNNSGEVYRETFREDMAERAWVKATSLPDGCEHVLPSLNLSILYMEQAEYQKAKRVIDNFEACVAQYPLRNGEEHRALVHLARGRIALHTGHIDDALVHLEQAIEKRQWFGKIGASQQDLTAATMATLAHALAAKNQHLATTLSTGLRESISKLKDRIHNRTRRWWLLRRTKQVLIEDLAGIEDLFVRNTDSVLDYPHLGETLAGIPAGMFRKRIELERQRDNRSKAVPYYRTYLADNLSANGKRKEAADLLREVIRTAREKEDAALLVHAMVKLAQLLPSDSEEYEQLATRIYTDAPAALRNAGLKLPVNFLISEQRVVDLLADTAFSPRSGNSLEFSVDFMREQSGQLVLAFRSKNGLRQGIRVSGTELETVVNELNEATFSEPLR